MADTKISALSAGSALGGTEEIPGVQSAATVKFTPAQIKTYVLTTPVAVVGNSTAGAEIRLPEDTDNGSDYVAIKAPSTLGASYTLTLPVDDGNSGEVLSTNGSGTLSWIAAPGASAPLTLASGTITSDSPAITSTQTWNSGGTTFTATKVNVTDTASAATSLLADFQVGGTSKFQIKKDGQVLSGLSGVGYSFTASSTTGWGYNGSMLYANVAGGTLLSLQYTNRVIYLGEGGTATLSINGDIGFSRAAAGVLEINNGSGTPGTLRDLYARNVRLNGTAVASLVAAATAGAGAMAYVTDATATTARSTVAGGGSNKVMVFSDGSNWLIMA